MDKATFLSELHAARAEFDQALAAVAPDRLETPGLFGDWSLKDLLAHISWYEREITETMSTHKLEGSGLWQLPNEPRNAALHERFAAVPLADVLAESQASYQALLNALESLVDADFTDPSRYEYMPADWPPGVVYADNSYDHYRAHLPTLRAAQTQK